jgi:hypothetical protein
VRKRKRRRRLALALAAAVLVAAVVAWFVRPSGAAAKTLGPIQFGYTVKGPIVSVNVFTLVNDANPNPPIAPRLTSLKTKRKASDIPPRLPRRVLARSAGIASIPGASGAPAAKSRRNGLGEVRLSQSHLLIAADGRRLYAAPTTHGAVCFVVAPGGVSDCVRRLSHGLAWLTLVQTPEGTVAAGLVPNRVTKVQLEIGSHRRTLTLARNAFLSDVSDLVATDIDAVIVTVGDARFRLPLDRRGFRTAP